jgi:hypothetical protein
MPPKVDVVGAVLVTSGLAVATYGLIETMVVPTIIGVALLAVFLVVEARVRMPLLPLTLFRSRQFSGANVTTFAVYAALGAALFLVTLQLQNGLGYSALEAGSALLPFTLLMLLLSSHMSAWSQKIGARPFMTIGPLVVAVGMLLFGQIEPGRSYWTTVLPATLVFGLGMATLVAPLTATVLASVDMSRAGIGSAVNNAVARSAGLLAVAVLPGLAGVANPVPGQDLGPGYQTAMEIAAGLCVVGAVVAFLTVRSARRHAPIVTPLAFPCQIECIADPAGAAEPGQAA